VYRQIGVWEFKYGASATPIYRSRDTIKFATKNCTKRP